MDSARQEVGVFTRKLARSYRVPQMTVQRELKRNGMSFKGIRECLK